MRTGLLMPRFNIFRSLPKPLLGLSLLCGALLLGPVPPDAVAAQHGSEIRLKLDHDLVPIVGTWVQDPDALASSSQASELQSRLLKLRDQVSALEQANVEGARQLSEREQFVDEIRALVRKQDKLVASLREEIRRPTGRVAAPAAMSQATPSPAPAAETSSSPIRLGPIELPAGVGNWFLEGALGVVIVLLLVMILHLRAYAKAKDTELAELAELAMGPRGAPAAAQVEAPAGDEDRTEINERIEDVTEIPEPAAAAPPPKVEATPPPKVEAAPPPPKVEAAPLPPKVEAAPPPPKVEAAPPAPKGKAAPPPEVEAAPPPKLEAAPATPEFETLPPLTLEPTPPPKGKAATAMPPKAAPTTGGAMEHAERTLAEAMEQAERTLAVTEAGDAASLQSGDANAKAEGGIGWSATMLSRKAADTDALKEVDTLIAFEDYEKAKLLLGEVMKSNPSSPEYRLRMLHLEATSGDKVKAGVEEEILSKMMEGPMSDTIYRVKEIGRGLLPGHPLFDDADTLNEAQRILDEYDQKEEGEQKAEDEHAKTMDLLDDGESVDFFNLISGETESTKGSSDGGDDGPKQSG